MLLIEEYSYVAADPKKTEHLVALDGAKERLTLFEATLTEEGSFDAAIDGCVCVFHTASPVLLSVDDPHAQLVDPAVKGTLSVLKSAAKVPSLKRVVLTSSMAAVVFGAKLPEPSDVVDETWFSDPVLCEQKKLWYMLSKTLAEDAAVKFSRENGLELVAINPGYVIGPILQPTLNMTSEGFMRMIETGQGVFADGIYRLVDVRDVAMAHILAFENPEANGRYCVVGKVIHSSDIMKIVAKLYPTLGHSKGYTDGKDAEPQFYSVSRVKAEGLGVEFTPVEHQTMSGEGKVVCVTGASGFIASWLVKLLLARGYSVVATVRSLGDPKKTEHLLALDGAKERLSLFEANLIEDGSFDSAVKGCVCVFHTASPVQFIVDDPQAQLIDPAVKGTLNVLNSASKVPSLRRVVLTSSMASVLFGAKVPVFGDVVDETWFSDPTVCQKRNSWYCVSKTMAEDAAVKFSQENDMDLVVINPGFVIGPILQPTLNNTSKRFMNFIKTGEDVFSDRVYILVDVRDVAIAHILAFEKPEANGRYCVVGNVSSEIMKIVEKLYPTIDHSRRYKDSKGVESLIYSVSRVKTEGLGVEFTPLEVGTCAGEESVGPRNGGSGAWVGLDYLISVARLGGQPALGCGGYINDLSAVKDNIKLRVRIVRSWMQDVYGKQGIKNMELVLMDEQSAKMQATVRMALVNGFKHKLEEGSAVTLSRYSLGDIQPKYRMVNKPLRLSFLSNTIIEPCPDFTGSIYVFDFRAFKTITDLQQEEDGQFDVIGHVVACDDLDNYDKNGRSGKKKPLTLADAELFADKDQAKSDNTASRISTQSRHSTRDEFLNKLQFKNIVELLDVDQGKASVIVGTVIAIHEEEGWWYLGCRKCNKKVVKESQFVDLETETKNKFGYQTANEWRCTKCDVIVTGIKTEYRLQLRVQDESGTISLSLFNDEVQAMVGRSAYQLCDKYGCKNAEDQNFPKEITNLVGKRYAFKVAIDEVNAKKLLPVFTVLRLTDDSDILNSIVSTVTPVKDLESQTDENTTPVENQNSGKRASDVERETDGSSIKRQLLDIKMEKAAK
ncbi:cinnamoyl-CoA reductase 1 [Artemisia annua]|uniref:Dihydroflavonol 4-reductase n=1 Tax=Artemisia annua TaxID=35608 RepID=A0A2U1N917_ARTAN|nr:cinnamoyl-CoA reductase 1 [Artemisia annua]QGV13662.1 dihydroflavonol reductase [Artemisia annua]